MLKRLFIICLCLLSLENGLSQSGLKALTKSWFRTEARVAESFASRTARIIEHIHVPNEQTLKGVCLLGYEESDFVFKIGEVVNGEVVFIEHKKVNKLPIDKLLNHELFIEPEIYFSNDFKPLKKRLENVNIFYDGEIYKVLTNKNQLQLTPSLICRFKDYSTLISVINIKTWNYRRKDFGIASILSEKLDYDTHSSLKQIVKKSKYNVLDRGNMESVFKASSGKLLLVTGHFQNNSFYARDFHFKPIKDKFFTFDELQQLSDKYDVRTIYLGCETGLAKNASGLSRKINNSQLINNLEIAFTKNNFYDFFSALGTEENPAIINNMDVSKDRFVIEIEIPKSSVDNTSRFIRMSSRLNPESRRIGGFESFLNYTVNFRYLICFFILYLICFVVIDTWFKNKRVLDILATSSAIAIIYWVLGNIILFIFY